MRLFSNPTRSLPPAACAVRRQAVSARPKAQTAQSAGLALVEPVEDGIEIARGALLP